MLGKSLCKIYIKSILPVLCYSNMLGMQAKQEFNQCAPPPNFETGALMIGMIDI